MDYLTNGGTPAASSGYPHQYKLWHSQNAIAQRNVEAWFTYSAGSGSDPTSTLVPAPTASNYDMADSSSPDYAYPIDGAAPDVQDFAWDLWNKYSTDVNTNLLASGSSSGTYGTLASPEVTFVTGTLDVVSGTTFEGTGILVIRDDYDPNVDTNNVPSTRAQLTISGEFKWTGLVIVVGWASSAQVNTGGDATIVGSFLGEDSVQSGGETSLDSATITLRVDGSFRIYYSSGLFEPGGPINSYLPLIKREIVGIRNL